MRDTNSKGGRSGTCRTGFSPSRRLVLAGTVAMSPTRDRLGSDLEGHWRDVVTSVRHL